ncbi:hypothetical protein CRX72_20480 [Pantoea sp. BRM17]|nr:hypothetical protein CRX72_20480 [Pantoea sp. BRM17]
MDDVDLAQEREAAHLESALFARKPRLVSATGNCIWCRDERVVDCAMHIIGFRCPLLTAMRHHQQTQTAALLHLC